MAVSRLKALLSDVWLWRLRDSPEFATTVNEHVYNDRLESLTLESYEKRHTAYSNFLQDLKKISKDELHGTDLISYEMLHDQLSWFVEGYKWRYHGAYNCVNFLENLPVDFVSYLIRATPFNTVEDFEMYIKRLECIEHQVPEQIRLMKEAIEHGTTNHQSSIEGAIKEIKKCSAAKPQDTVFFQPFKANLVKSKDISDEHKSSLVSRGKSVISKNVQTPLSKLASFLENKYLPNTRRTLGVSGLPNGEDYYQQCLTWHLSIDMTPKQVYDLGIKEVKRIRDSMEKVRADVKFDGDLKAFMDHLRTDKKFYHTTKEELLDEYKEIIDHHIAPKLPTLFGRFPDIALEVEAMPYDGPGGMYLPSTGDGTRPGMFYANLNQPEARPRYGMVSLSLHEASPGHHFQFSFALKESLPLFRKEFDWRKLYACPMVPPTYNAYVEGWGLYSEYLGEELGAYRNPYDMFGRYSDEIFRACRLVVDTGLHVFGWSKEDAIKYMLDNTCCPLDEIQEEVNRYITWPGQACAYKVGEIKIKELRKRAEAELLDKFDVKGFHNCILSLGAVPLSILERAIDEWIEEKKKK